MVVDSQPPRLLECSCGPSTAISVPGETLLAANITFDEHERISWSAAVLTPYPSPTAAGYLLPISKLRGNRIGARQGVIGPKRLAHPGTTRRTGAWTDPIAAGDPVPRRRSHRDAVQHQVSPRQSPRTVARTTGELGRDSCGRREGPSSPSRYAVARRLSAVSRPSSSAAFSRTAWESPNPRIRAGSRMSMRHDPRGSPCCASSRCATGLPADAG
jgi:hypothetical protein